MPTRRLTCVPPDRSAAEAFCPGYRAGSIMNGSSEKLPTPFDDGVVDRRDPEVEGEILTKSVFQFGK